jgi:DNA-binding response OmpR family regulator
MITLIVTANDQLYDRLSARTRAQGNTCQRAKNVLDGFKLALVTAADSVIIDMSLHAADTLIETLHSRPTTAGLRICVVQSAARLPFELRRLCTDVLEADAL